MRPDVNREQLADQVKELRGRRGWRQKDLAAACAALGATGLNRSTIGKIESLTRLVHERELPVLAAALGVTVAELLGTAGTGWQPADPPTIYLSYTPKDQRWSEWIAWELERAGHRTVFQAWDFVPSSNFIDFMDRGLSEADIVLAVLSEDYLRSRWGRLEWQTAMRANPDDPRSRLITVLVGECELDGFLATITYIDLLSAPDAATARRRLLDGLDSRLAGRAKPLRGPNFPLPRADAAPGEGPPGLGSPERDGRPRPGRHLLGAAPAYPPTAAPRREEAGSVSILWLPGPRFGAGGTIADPTETQNQAWAAATRLVHDGAPEPDLLVIAGDLTENGKAREFEAALSFLLGLRTLLRLEPDRLVVVPGRHDVSQAACAAYFANCAADDTDPVPPYWTKWRHFDRVFRELAEGPDAATFESGCPWSLFEIPDLHVVVAGINTTVAQTHLEADDHGYVGPAQATWFAQQLRAYEKDGWLRVGAMNHAPGNQPAGGPGLIADGPMFDSVVGPRLNLLLTGQPGPAGAGATDRPDRPLVLGAEPAEPALLEIRPDGLRRWRLPGADAPHAQDAGPSWSAHRWTRASATFGAYAPSGPVPAAPPAGDEQPIRLGPDRLGDLFERIAEVCRARHAGARVRPIGGPTPHLLVTQVQDGIVRQSRIGAVLGTVTPADVDVFERTVRALDPAATAELVCEVPPPPGPRTNAARRGIRVRSFVEFQGLLDLSDFVARQSARLRADRQYPPDLYVSQCYRDLSGASRAIHGGLVDDLLASLAEDTGQFLLLLGDFGRGKTFALRELARRIPEQLPHLQPIYLELRMLDKAHSVAGLVAAHLADHGHSLVDLRAFSYMLAEGRIVLLFDGFDELASRVTYERATEHLDTLLDAAHDNAKIIVTSRTQHFQTDQQVFTALGARVGAQRHRRVLSVEDFGDGQIRSYLVNRYGGDEGAARARLDVISDVPDLIGLSRNPRMLSFIADLPAAKLATVARSKGALSAARLYQEIVDTWLSFEAERTGGVPGAQAGLSRDQLWTAVTALALRLWESAESYLRLPEIQDVAARLADLAVTTGPGRARPRPRPSASASASASAPAAAEDGPSSQQTAHALGAGSLLVRTEDGLFGFIHSSVAEWLVAHEIAERFGRGDDSPGPLGRRVLSPLSVEFLADLADPVAVRSWIVVVTADGESDDVSRTNALRVGARLRTQMSGDLRGAFLAGEDLSYREMRGVDLSGADLTDAQLAGSDLSDAVLRGSRLVGARLDDARLTGADLTGADLTGARLLGTDLRRVTAEAASWRRAAVIGARISPELAEAVSAGGAAVTPGCPIEVGLAPSTVSVNFGFEAGRLPHPVAYSPDGLTIAVAGEDGGVLICDADGLPIRSLQGHRERVHAVVQGERTIATASLDTTVRLWDPLTGRDLGALPAHHRWVWPFTLEAGGERLATGAGDGVVRVWSPSERAELAALPGHGERIWTAVFDPAGRLLATGDDTGTARLFDLGSGQLVRELTGHHQSVYRVAFSPDGTLLATSDHQGVVRVWDVDGLAGSGPVHELAGHPAAVYTLDFHPTEPLLASGDTAGQVRLWRLAGGADGVAGPGGRAPDIQCGGAVYRVLFSPDGRRLAVGDSDGVLRLADPLTGVVSHELAGHKGSLWPMEFRPDGRQVVTASNDGTARIWDAATGLCLRTVSGHGRRLTSLRFSADGRTLATCGNDGIIRLWEPRSGQYVGQLSGVSDRLVSAVFRPDLPTIAATSAAGTVHLWRRPAPADDGAGQWSYERELRVETDNVWAEEFSPDGDLIATANDDDTVRLWYSTTGRPVLTLADHRGRVRSVAFSPDGQRLATGCDDRLARVWRIPSGEALLTLSGHTDRIYAVAFSADGSVLATVSNDGTARLWDAASGDLLHVLAGHSGRLWTGAFSPDGQLLATAGDDLVVRLWDMATGRPVAELGGHTRRVLSVTFSPDGGLLASCGDDGTARLWRLDGADVRAGLTLLGLENGWAATAPDGRYRMSGDLAGQVWHVVGPRRFALGELEPYVGEARALAGGAPS